MKNEQYRFFPGIFFLTLFLLSPVFAIDRLSLKGQLQYRKWVTAAALQLFQKGSPVIKLDRQNEAVRWSAENRDCAGLIRYLHFEAGTVHNNAYRGNAANILTRFLDDIAEKVPPLLDKSGNPARNADARTLYEVNTYPVTREITSDAVKEADLLFFKNSDDWHVMMLMRETLTGKLVAVYHTGDKRAELRLVPINDLLRHHEARWHPRSSNNSFLGIRRLYFLQ